MLGEESKPSREDQYMLGSCVHATMGQSNEHWDGSCATTISSYFFVHLLFFDKSGIRGKDIGQAKCFFYYGPCSYTTKIYKEREKLQICIAMQITIILVHIMHVSPHLPLVLQCIFQKQPVGFASICILSKLPICCFFSNDILSLYIAAALPLSMISINT